LILSFALLTATRVSAGAFQIRSSSVSNAVFRVEFPANTNSYYILYRGTNLTNIVTVVQVAAGTGTVSQLTDTNTSLPAAFYRVQQVSNSPAPVLTSLNPATATIPTAGSLSLTATIDIPAPPGGTTIALQLAPPGAGTIPATLTVPPGLTSANFTYVDNNTAASATITATLGTVSFNSALTMQNPLPGLVINEIDYDNIGTDSSEFVELYNTSSSAINLTNLALVFINGNDNVEYARVPLLGILAAHSYLVLASSNVVVATGATVQYFTNLSNNIQNGAPDGIAIYDTVQNAVVDALAYEGPITAAQIIGHAGGVNLVEGTALAASVADSNTINQSLIRYPNGQDLNNASGDWRLTGTPTPGAANVP
jgi:hypothetical protein